MNTAEKVKLIKEELIHNYNNKITSLLTLCESPIEQLFLINFLGYCESKTGLETYTNFLYDYPETFDNGTYSYKNTIKPYIAYKTDNPVPWIPIGIHYHAGFNLFITPQAEIETVTKKYRVDFLLLYEMHTYKIKIVVECDGHDFHQKTKVQVEKDNLRDRDLIENGYQVLRYSGSELYAKSDFTAFKTLVEQLEEIMRLPIKQMLQDF